MIFKILFMSIYYIHNSFAIINHYNNELEVLNEIKIKKTQKNQKQVNLLLVAKKLLIKGEYTKARYLTNLINSTSQYYPIRLYYQAIISFIEKKYHDSTKQLQNPILNKTEYYSNICILKVLSFLATGNKKIKDETSRCKFFTSKYSNNFQIWLQYLTDVNKKEIDLFSSKHNQYLKYFLTNIEFTKILMKIAIYNHQEEDIVSEFKKFPTDFYKDQELKELLAYTFIKLEKKKLALKFLENINTPNAENLKGNLLLSKKKYELALGHFELALKYNPLSKNSLFRILPISWKLKKFQRAISILKKLKYVDKDFTSFIYYLSLLAQKKDTKEMTKVLNLKYKNYLLNEMPLIVNHLINYLYILLQNREQIKYYSRFLCMRGELIQCLQYKNISFDKFYLTDIKKNKYILKKQVIDLSKQKIFIDQKDILELDIRKLNQKNFTKNI